MVKENNLEEHFLNPQISFQLTDFILPLIGPLAYSARNYTQPRPVKVSKSTRMKDVAYQFYGTALTVGPMIWGVNYALEKIGGERIARGLEQIVKYLQ